ncbi:hypothetical protein [Leifsonia sp. AG29]|uniref:hypothetical protein n=1 Tax=Leifsonia sp. AG29 TaxID=2598860 RepID=UPI001E28BC48|nr:hypothetical protein [Leifsonia sp. AG29]
MTIPGDESNPEQPGGTPAQPPTPAEPAAGGVPATPPPAGGDLPPAPPAYAAPPAQDGFSAYPSSAPAPAPVAPAAPPRTVNIAFWLYIASAVLSVISGILTIILISSQRDQQLRVLQDQGNLQGANPNTLVDAIQATVITLSIVTLIFWAVTFVLFAFFARRGAGWARIVLTVLTVLSLLNLLAGYGVGALQVIASIVAIVLLWLRPSSEYFAAVKASKAPRA